MKISKNRWENAPFNHKKFENNQKLIWIETESRWESVEIVPVEISPIYGELTIHAPWEGNCSKKPWEYEVTAVIPCLNTSETLNICIELLRLQTIKPYIMVIDTGSTEDHLNKVLQLRDVDLEVHTIALNGVYHPSDYPAMAMDLAFSLCRTEFLFATHADCFLRRQNLIEDFIQLCKTKSSAVGYELSPRPHDDWKGMLSHTASMYHMETMDKIGFGWSLRRLCHEFGIKNYKPNPMKPNWPDTEILGNYILRKNNIIPHLVGGEENQSRTKDNNIDHFRSYTSGKMYSPEYFKIAQGWYKEATLDAQQRIIEWRSNFTCLLESETI